MHFNNIKISYFKSISDLQWQMDEGLNIILGKNGVGKTNFLDAIHYICLTKSFLANADNILIHEDADFFRIQATIAHGEFQNVVTAAYSAHTKKKITVDGELYEKLSHHIGKYPVVLFAPDDTDLVRGSSETRRKFFDVLICQFDSSYLETLTNYNHILKQRNHYLKQLFLREKLDQTLLEIYDTKLIHYNKQICDKRKQILHEFIPFFLEHYDFVSSSKETPHIAYESDVLHLEFELKFRNNIEKDIATQRTNLGVHTDDFSWLLDHKNTKKYASQGQKKSFVLALKLAQFTVLYQKTGIKPVLLMDDIFDKLDDLRIHKLLKMLSNNTFGQVFITDARPERTRLLLAEIPFKEFLL